MNFPTKCIKQKKSCIQWHMDISVVMELTVGDAKWVQMIAERRKQHIPDNSGAVARFDLIHTHTPTHTDSQGKYNTTTTDVRHTEDHTSAADASQLLNSSV